MIYLFLTYLDPTQMGGLSMLLLAGEHALGTPEVSGPSSLSTLLLLGVENTDICVLFTLLVLQFHFLQLMNKLCF